jgi:hypothetical protein
MHTLLDARCCLGTGACGDLSHREQRHDADLPSCAIRAEQHQSISRSDVHSRTPCRSDDHTHESSETAGRLFQLKVLDMSVVSLDSTLGQRKVIVAAASESAHWLLMSGGEQ